MKIFSYIKPGICIVPIAISGCSSCVFPDSKETIAPNWVCDGRIDGIEHSAVGYAEKSAAGESFMKQLAASKARSALATNQASDGNKIARRDGQDSSTHLTKKVLINARVIETASSPTGRLYVLVGIVPEQK